MTTTPAQVPRLGGDALAGWHRGLGAAVERLDRVCAGVRAVCALGVEPPSVSAGALLSGLYADGDVPPEPFADPGVDGPGRRVLVDAPERTARRPPGAVRARSATAGSPPDHAPVLASTRTDPLPPLGFRPTARANAGRTGRTGAGLDLVGERDLRSRPASTQPAAAAAGRPTSFDDTVPTWATSSASETAERVVLRPGPAAPLTLIAARAGQPMPDGPPPRSARVPDLPSEGPRTARGAATEAGQLPGTPYVPENEPPFRAATAPDVENGTSARRGSVAGLPAQEVPGVRRIWSESQELGGPYVETDTSPAADDPTRSDSDPVLLPRAEPPGLASPLLADRLGAVADPQQGKGFDDEAVERVVERMLADAARRHGIEV